MADRYDTRRQPPPCYIHALTRREQHIKAGEGIIASNQSGSRDEDVFPNPDVFDMHRELKKDGLGFGYGPHRCIAETLSKAELTAVFSKPPPPTPLVLDWKRSPCSSRHLTV